MSRIYHSSPIGSDGSGKPDLAVWPADIVPSIVSGSRIRNIPSGPPYYI